MVTFQEKCLLFDRKDGKFVCEVGHVGVDPTGYSEGTPYYDEAHDWFYFSRKPNQLVKYDTQGHYLDTFTFPQETKTPDYCLFNDSLIIGYHSELMPGKTALTIFTPTGQVVDSIPSVHTKGVDISQIKKIEVRTFGNLGLILITTPSAYVAIGGGSNLWKSNGQAYFMESFSDTVYTVAKNRLTPYVIFHTGTWKSGEEIRMVPLNLPNCLMVGSVLDSPKGIFFQCATNIYDKKTEKTFNAVYDKASGKTTMAPLADQITDDLSHGMPFCPQSVSSQGEYACLIQAADVLEWMDKHPEAKQQPWWEALKNLKEDDNPVAIIVSE
jgi:hypothetical protein